MSKQTFDVNMDKMWEEMAPQVTEDDFYHIIQRGDPEETEQAYTNLLSLFDQVRRDASMLYWFADRLMECNTLEEFKEHQEYVKTWCTENPYCTQEIH